MSLAFSAPPARSRRVLVLVGSAHGCALLGLAAGALQLAAGGALAASGLLIAAALPLALGWRRAAGAALPPGRLEVDARGEATWHPPGLPGAGPGLRFEPLRWLVFGGLVWLHARVDGRRLDLLSGRDALPDAAWRGLLRWLRWLDQGR